MAFIKNYEDIRSNSNRQYIRRGVLDFLSGVQEIVSRVAPINEENRIQFLYIHHVFEDEEKALRDLLIHLREEYKFISYSDAVKKILTANIDDKYICFSSDDGFKNNIKAASIFDEFGVKCCFFICPNIVGVKDYNKLNEFTRKRLNMAAVEFMGWNEIEELKKNGHEIGGHTLNHAKLSEVEFPQAEDEIRQSYEIILKELGDVTHFAWPYGRFFHFNETLKNIVFEAGYKSCASAERGCHINSVPLDFRQLCIRRDHLVLDWPIRHVKYFLARNSKKLISSNNLFPY